MARRSLQQHAAAAWLTALSVALASGLAMSVWAVEAQAFRAFTGGPAGFDAVLGARGSQLQLVLNTVFHLETSPGNIPWSFYEEMKRDPRVELAIPYAVGDNYRGFRIVGTTESLFTDFHYREGQRFRLEPGGRWFAPDQPEAVIGSTVAQRTRLKAGARFRPSHGLYSAAGSGHGHHDGDHEDDADEHAHEDVYTVTGVLKPTNSPSDRVIWIPVEGLFRMDGHVLRGAGVEYRPEPGVEIPDEHKEVSAVMLKLKNPMAGFALHQSVNRQGREATLAWPVASVMADLFDKLGWMSRVLRLVALLVAAVAAASVAAALYASLNGRQREFAILRALGARRRTLLGAVMLETAAISAGGAMLGWAVYGAILALTATVIRQQTGVVIAVLEWHPALVAVPAALTLLGTAAGLLPAARAYRTNVAAGLAPAN